MKITSKYNPSQNSLLLTAKGKFSLDVYQQTLVYICSNSEFAANVPTIWDLRYFDFKTFDKQAAYKVRNFRRDYKSRLSAKVAVIVKDKLGYGMTRLLMAISNAEEKSHVCYDLKEATRWLLQ